MKSKCCNADVFTQDKGDKIGIYCKECGRYQKWASKDDLRVIDKIPNNNLQESFDIDICKRKLEFYESKLKEMWDSCEYMIDKEMELYPMSFEDSIRKNSKCATLEGCKATIEKILLEGNNIKD